jgi:glycosyltransferase involved in cell wall biosynthesis
MDSNNFSLHSKKVKYSLVIPCFNEAENLMNLIDRCKYLLDENQETEVIIVDNGSTDNSSQVLTGILKNYNQERLRAITILKNEGYGNGIICGLEECVGDILGWTHADLQTDPVDFLNAISIIDLAENSELIFIKGRRYGRSFFDVFFTWGMSLVEWLVLRERLSDINAQPTVFSRKFYLSIKKPPRDFSIDLFFYYQAVRQNLIIHRFPVSFESRLKGIGHNEKLISKIKYSWKTILYSIELKKYLKNN